MNTDKLIIEIILGEAYFNQGFFNIRKKFDEEFGKDKAFIEIQFGDDQTKIEKGIINRTANINRTPRIMIGKKYNEWIHKNFNKGDVFYIEKINNRLVLKEKNKKD